MTTWLLTSTFYGQWLPGDPRGSVANVRDRRPDDAICHVGREHAAIGEEYDGAMPGLQRASAELLKGEPISLDLAQAQLLDQMLETAQFRGWTLHAVSIMFNHIHAVVEAPSNVGKSK